MRAWVSSLLSFWPLELFNQAFGRDYFFFTSVVTISIDSCLPGLYNGNMKWSIITNKRLEIYFTIFLYVPALCIILEKFSFRKRKNIFFISCEGVKYVENLTGVILNPDMLLLIVYMGNWALEIGMSLDAPPFSRWPPTEPITSLRKIFFYQPLFKL